jgi:DNA-binding NtrC family response regulator
LINDAQPANPTLESIEKAYIHYVLSQAEGRKAEAARILGIDTSTLYRKLDRYEMTEPKRRKPSGTTRKRKK